MNLDRKSVKCRRNVKYIIYHCTIKFTKVTYYLLIDFRLIYFVFINVSATLGLHLKSYNDNVFTDNISII